MNEIRSFASLSGSLLARKGGARPAMRPQPLSNLSSLDDLGWDDMGAADEAGHEHVPSSISALTPAPKPILSREEDILAQQRVLNAHFSEEENAEPLAAVPDYQPEAEVEPEPEPAAELVEPEVVAEPAFAEESPSIIAEEAPFAVAIKPKAKASAKAKAKAINRPAAEARDSGRKAAFTLRLDADRHLRLRLASAVCGQSSQQLVTAALDAFLETLPEIGSLARQLPRGGTN